MKSFLIVFLPLCMYGCASATELVLHKGDDAATIKADNTTNKNLGVSIGLNFVDDRLIQHGNILARVKPGKHMVVVRTQDDRESTTNSESPVNYYTIIFTAEPQHHYVFYPVAANSEGKPPILFKLADTSDNKEHQLLLCKQLTPGTWSKAGNASCVDPLKIPFAK